MSDRYLVLVSAARETCGVEAFARQLVLQAPGRGESWPLDHRLAAFIGRLRSSRGVVINFPVVAWKRQLFRPLVMALLARLKRKDVIVVLHEWAALDWKRRIVLAPVIVLARKISFSAPEIAKEFAASPLSRFTADHRVLIPIPPNLRPPLDREDTAATAVLAEQRRRGRMILGHFGSIYPKKQSTVVLQVAENLVARGHDVFVVFIGSFIKGGDSVEEDFTRAITATGMAERVLVTGYVETDSQLFALFDHVDLFCYVFSEGLTSRRGSVLAAALSGKPVVVNAPESADALEHHVLYRSLVEAGAIRLVPTGADVEEVASAAAEALTRPAPPLDRGSQIDAVWHDVGKTLFG